MPVCCSCVVDDLWQRRDARVIGGLLGGSRAANTWWNQASLSRPGHLRSYGLSPQMLLDGSKPRRRRIHFARLLGSGRTCNAWSFSF